MEGEQSRQSHTFVDRAPFFIVGVLLLLLPFFFIPSVLVAIPAAKALLIFVAVALTTIAWVLTALRDGSVSFPRTWLLVAFGALSLVYLLASVFFGQMGTSLVGDGATTDTFVSILAASLLVLLIPAAVRSKRDMLLSYAAVIIGFLVVFLIQLVRLFVDVDTFTLSALFTSTATVFGKWNDLGIFSGLILLLSVLALELFRTDKVVRTVLYVVSVLSVFMLAVVQFTPVWYVVGIFFLLFVIYQLSLRQRSSAGSFFPVFAGIVVVLAAFFIFAGGPVETTLTNQFNTGQVEVRPSWEATFSVAGETLRESPVFGAGPNRFSEAWFMNKPDGVNGTAFWNVAFNMGVGFIPTSLVTVGLLGFIAWIAVLILFLYLGARYLFRSSYDPTSRYFVISSFLGALYAWIFFVIYTPGLVMFTMAFILTGLFLASLQQAHVIGNWTFSFSEHQTYNFVGALISVVVIIVVGVGAYATISRFSGGVLHRQGIVRAQAGDIDGAERSVQRALQFGERALLYRTLAGIQTTQLNSVLQQEGVGVEELRTQFQSVLSNAVSSAQRATAVADGDYRNFMILGRIYADLVPVGVQGAYDTALQTYENARERSPHAPDVLLALANLEVRNGNNTAAREYIFEALDIKPNYTDAIFLLSQIDIAEGNVAQAISSVEAATILAPNNPAVFFQLGILQYSSNNFSASAAAFERAVSINRSYANARYFLGLSYDQLGRRDEAIAQFEVVQKLNPDNQEVINILSNLRDNLPPFSNVQPPLDDEPESRDELPAEEPIAE